MGSTRRGDASIQQHFLPSPSASPAKQAAGSKHTHAGDGFTAEEIQEALKPTSFDWHPGHEYEDCDIGSLQPGTRAVMFMGRVANIYDVGHTPKTPRSAKGCIKLCVKDGESAITVRFWYVSHQPALRLGSLVTVWTNHISNGESSTLSSSNAPLFASLFPERDRNCHLMLHENSDDCEMYRTPLGYREGMPLDGLMTLRSFEDGGYDVTDAKILVVVKSIGAKKKVTRRDGSVTENVNLQVHDDTAEATLGLWGSLSSSPATAPGSSNPEATACQSWRPGETVLLIQTPGWRIGRTTYLSLTSATIVDVNPVIPDAEWLQRWALRQKCREAINPPFPQDTFDAKAVTSSVVRCLFTIADLDVFARCAPTETFQDYLSLLIMETRLLDLWRRNMLLCSECCNIPTYANALSTICKGCDRELKLRLNTRILGQVIDETAAIGCGKLLLCDRAWYDLLGRGPEDLLKLEYDEIKYLSDRLLFCRITVLFGWTGDQSKAGGRICVLEVQT